MIFCSCQNGVKERTKFVKFESSCVYIHTIRHLFVLKRTTLILTEPVLIQILINKRSIKIVCWTLVVVKMAAKKGQNVEVLWGRRTVSFSSYLLIAKDSCFIYINYLNRWLISYHWIFIAFKWFINSTIQVTFCCNTNACTKTHWLKWNHRKPKRFIEIPAFKPDFKMA